MVAGRIYGDYPVRIVAALGLDDCREEGRGVAELDVVAVLIHAAKKIAVYGKSAALRLGPVEHRVVVQRVAAGEGDLARSADKDISRTPLGEVPGRVHGPHHEGVRAYGHLRFCDLGAEDAAVVILSRLDGTVISRLIPLPHDVVPRDREHRKRRRPRYLYVVFHHADNRGRSRGTGQIEAHLAPRGHIARYVYGSDTVAEDARGWGRKAVGVGLNLVQSLAIGVLHLIVGEFEG